MKKSKVIALALAAAITSMGAGYAAWQDSVTIKSQVNTGSLDIRFCDNNDLPVVSVDQTNLHVTMEDPVVTNDENGGIAKVLKIKASNFYPSKDVTSGSGFKDRYEIPALNVTAGIINAGSIPAKLDNVVISNDGSPEIYNKIKVEKGVLCKVYNNDYYIWNIFTGKWVLLDREWNLGVDYERELSQYSRKDDMTLAEFEKFLNDSIGKDYVLGGTSTIFMGSILKTESESVKVIPQLRLYIDESAGNDTQDKNCTINIKFNWKQFNK